VSAADHERFGEDAAVYLLGALEDAERDAFEVHLATCHVCQDEVARLRVAADALPRSVVQFDPPPSLKRALMEQVHSEAAPERRAGASLADRLGIARVLARPRLALAATACALLVGLVAGYALSSGGAEEGTRTIAATVDTTRIGDSRATLVVPEDGDSAHLEVSAMPQPPEGEVYEVWLRRGDRIEPGPLFGVDRNGNGVAAVPGDLDGVTEVMVTRERAGGARQPTEAPVVSAKV
jgi:anti-sigma-K factor RskA